MKNLLEFISRNDPLSVDWEGVEKTIRGEEGRHEEEMNNLIENLSDIGYLKHQEVGTFMVFGEGMNLGPNTSWMTEAATFAQQKEAENYAKARYKRAMYDVRILEVKTETVNR